MDAAVLLKNRLFEQKIIEKQNDIFFRDVICGLSSNPKYLDSKYFYDAVGDKIFQEIMYCGEYYLTGCELEILSNQSRYIAGTICSYLRDFDIVELGPGDASKSINLLEAFCELGINYTYYPIDISENLISSLEIELPQKLPGITVDGLNGDYIDMIDQLNDLTNKKKIVMFLGASIGNFLPAAAEEFLVKLRKKIHPGDLLLIGFDLKKNPKIILDAYNDKQGITKSFNLNLLRRINNTLDADFDLKRFEHFPVYDPETGACKSFLISLKDQTVHFGANTRILFSENESILMEVSQKYTTGQVNRLSLNSGFKPVNNFFDSKKWFLDALWINE
jgi:dimethylhistidine N-methyltransferase